MVRKADKDQSGEISVLEFLMFFDIDRTVFAVKAFTHMDDDRSGKVTYTEFSGMGREELKLKASDVPDVKLQGAWNASDGFVFTDPVPHAVTAPETKHANGATDPGAAGTYVSSIAASAASMSPSHRPPAVSSLTARHFTPTATEMK